MDSEVKFHLKIQSVLAISALIAAVGFSILYQPPVKNIIHKKITSSTNHLKGG